MPPKRSSKAAASASVSASTGSAMSSIGRFYEGDYGYTKLVGDDVQERTELKVRTEMAKRILSTPSDAENDEDDAIEHFHFLKSHVEMMDNDLESTDHGFKTMTDALRQLNFYIDYLRDEGPMVRKFDERSYALLEDLAALRCIFEDLFQPGGKADKLEYHKLREAVSILRTERDHLLSYQETLKSQVIAAYRTQAPSANTIEGIELPDWFPHKSEHPFSVIQQALEHLEQVNDKLHTRCLQLEQREVTELRMEHNADAAERFSIEGSLDEMMNSHGDQSTYIAGLHSEIGRLKEQLAAQTENVTKARGKIARRNVEITRLMKRCKALARENVKLNQDIADRNWTKAMMDETSRTAEERVKDARRQEETLTRTITEQAEARIADGKKQMEDARLRAEELVKSAEQRARGRTAEVEKHTRERIEDVEKQSQERVDAVEKRVNDLIAQTGTASANLSSLAQENFDSQKALIEKQAAESMRRVQQQADDSNKLVREQADDSVKISKQSANQIVKQAEDLLDAARRREEAAMADKNEAHRTVRSMRDSMDTLNQTIRDKGNETYRLKQDVRNTTDALTLAQDRIRNFNRSYLRVSILTYWYKQEIERVGGLLDTQDKWIAEAEEAIKKLKAKVAEGNKFVANVNQHNVKKFHSI